MELDLFRTLWGVTSPVEQLADNLKQNGFTGVEGRLPETTAERKKFRQALTRSELDYIAIIFTGGDVIPNQAELPEQHLTRLARQLDEAAELNARFVNVLPGCDRWPLAQQVDFFGAALDVAKKSGLLCSFETHRATSLYSPWLTLELIEQVPELHFTTDISHWVLVSERLLNHELDNLSAFIERVHHVQARVGYDQGAQVPHPAAPEYANALQFHQMIWEQVWRQHLQNGYQRTTMTTEFGPDGYLHHLPFTDVPVADLWSLNTWMAHEERRHFTQFIEQHQAQP